MFYSPSLPLKKVCVCGTYAHTHRLKVLKVATQRCMIDKRQEMKHSLESFTSHQTSAEICFAVQNCALNKCGFFVLFFVFFIILHSGGAAHTFELSTNNLLFIRQTLD